MFSQILRTLAAKVLMGSESWGEKNGIDLLYSQGRWSIHSVFQQYQYLYVNFDSVKLSYGKKCPLKNTVQISSPSLCHNTVYVRMVRMVTHNWRKYTLCGVIAFTLLQCFDTVGLMANILLILHIYMMILNKAVIRSQTPPAVLPPGKLL